MELEEIQKSNRESLHTVNQELFEAKKKIVKTTDREKVLKKEVLRLRDTVSDLKNNVKDLEVDPHTRCRGAADKASAERNAEESRLDRNRKQAEGAKAEKSS